jgi:hypothetical protein
MTFLKHFGFIGVSYLVLRELPIRNFYARSVIWGLIGMKVFTNYSFDLWNNSIVSQFYLNAPAHFQNQFKIFEFARRSMEDLPAEKLGGVSAYDKWKLTQPGFMTMNYSTPMFVG